MTSIQTINLTFQTQNGEVKNESLPLRLKVNEKYQSLDNSEKWNYLIYRSLQKQKANDYKRLASTKTRSEVRGGGRKPWKQKGTGKARAGSTRSPLWKGGGVTFGPKPVSRHLKINRKEWRLSLKLLLSLKANNILVVENFQINSFKTKDLVNQLLTLNLNPLEKIVIIVPEINSELRLASRNLTNIIICTANNLNLKYLIDAKTILTNEASLKIIETTYQ